MKIETIAVHAGAEVDSSTGAVAPPIHLSTTYEHGPASEEIHGYATVNYYFYEESLRSTRGVRPFSHEFDKLLLRF